MGVTFPNMVLREAILVLLYTFVIGDSQKPSIEKESINLFFRSLNYDPSEILVYRGEGVASFQKREGKLDDEKKFIVTTREKKTLTNGNADIGVITSNEHITYPGAFLSANSDLMDNNPRLLTFDREPMQYTVNLPGLLNEDAGFKVDPTFYNFKQGHNKIVNTWFEKYIKDHDIFALFQSDSSFAYSKEQLRVKFSLDFKATSVESKIDFDSINKQKKTVMVHKFKQVFYTVSAVPPMRPEDFFKSTVTKSDLESKIDNKNPAVMVDSVSYGRMIYVVMETSSTDRKSKALMEAKLSKIDMHTSSDVDYSKELKNFNIQVFVMGGSSNHIELINVKTLKDVADVIIKYNKFSRTNLGYPISYSTMFIKDNTRAIVRSSAEYIETTREEFNKGIFRLAHHGAYVAQFSLSWDEVKFDQRGDEVISREHWDGSWRDLTAPFAANIELPGNARNIAIMARECTGLAWDWWRKVVDRKGVPLINWRQLKIWGTTLDPAQSIRPAI